MKFWKLDQILLFFSFGSSLPAAAAAVTMGSDDAKKKRAERYGIAVVLKIA